MTMPAISAIRRAWPEAHISLLVRPWVADLFRYSSDIDHIIYYDKRYRGITGRIRLSAILRKEHFTRAILLQNAFDAALIAWLARIPERTGYRRDHRGFLLSNAVPVEQDRPDKHQIHYYLDLVKAIGVSQPLIQPFIRLSDKERKWASMQISSHFKTDSGPVVGINPGASYGSAKRWLPERFAEVIISVISDLGGKIILFGGPDELEIADEIITAINRIKIRNKIQSTGSSIMVMAGKTDLLELASLIAECDVFLSNDSGPMHMASALCVPVVAIFGSTDSTATGPYGNCTRVISKNLNCSPCIKRECPEGNLECMTAVSSEEVFEAVRDILPKKRAVFLDKDGTLIEDRHYLNSFEDLKILRGVKSALKRLKASGFALIGITNQSGIARGIVDEDFVRESNEYLKKELGLDDFLYCPHHPDDNCACRKPEPMLLCRARCRHGIKLGDSYIIGDKESDVRLAKHTKSTGILLSSTPLFENTCASYIAPDLGKAVDWILAERKPSRA